jgi:transposase-like protein
MLTVASQEETGRAGAASGGSLLDEIVRDGARRMLAASLEAEVAGYVAAHADQVDEAGRRLVVRNGHAQPREVLTSSGAVGVRAPRVNDRRTDDTTGERHRFSSAILPPWCRKSPKINEVLPLLYLHGLSSQDFGPALEGFLGSSAGLSAATITRLTAQWQDEARAFNDRDLSGVDYVYVWADGIHVGVRLDEERLCLLVLIGVRADGTKELIALSDGLRESTGSWADLLRDARRRGMRAPVLAVARAAARAGTAREVPRRARASRAGPVPVGWPVGAGPAPASGGPGPRRGRRVPRRPAHPSGPGHRVGHAPGWAARG